LTINFYNHTLFLAENVGKLGAKKYPPNLWISKWISYVINVK
jgi:hypothetical protein